MLCSFFALMGYAVLADSARDWLAAGPRTKLFNRVSGSILVVLGLTMLRLDKPVA